MQLPYARGNAQSVMAHMYYKWHAEQRIFTRHASLIVLGILC